MYIMLNRNTSCLALAGSPVSDDGFLTDYGAVQRSECGSMILISNLPFTQWRLAWQYATP